MCGTTIHSEKKYAENYIAHCYKKVNVRVYQVNDEIANKSYEFNLKKELGCVKVVTAVDFFTDENLLLHIERGENYFDLEQVVEAAHRAGMEEVHICDMSCSSFFHEGEEVEGHIDHITRWEKQNFGGGGKRLSHRPLHR